MLKKIITFLFPPDCAGCGKENELLCERCFNRLKVCKPREISPTVYAFFSYRERAVKEALWSLKFKNTQEFADIFAEFLYRHLRAAEEGPGSGKCFLVPIPLSSKKGRGYNHSHILAQKLARKGGMAFAASDILTRKRNTKPQRLCATREERLKNIAGAFAVSNKSAVRGRNIIVIDDVVTTGATAKEARRALETAGARSVCVWAIAHQPLGRKTNMQ